MASQQSSHQANVNVNVQSTGIGKLVSQWGEFSGALLGPIAILASGGSKIKAIWEGVKGVIVSKVLGPLELGVGASLAFLTMTKRLVSAWKELGMQSSATLERMTVQFRPLLGSMERARDRVKELMAFSAKTPFRLEAVAEANQILQNLTKGALASEAGMTLVGDAAAMANEGLAEMATQVGRLYDGLMSGRPVGMFAMRLQELGAISGQTRNQIESMQAAGRNGMEIWAIASADIGKANGAMIAMSTTLEGLQSTLADTRQQMQAGFSDGFLKGEKAGAEASIKTMEAMVPVAQSLGKFFGELNNAWAEMKKSVVDAVTGWKGFADTITWVIKGMVMLAAAFAGSGLVAIGAFVVKILAAAAGMKVAAQSQMMLNAVQGSSVGVMTKLRSIKASLTAAAYASAAGLRAEAVAHMQASGAAARSIVTTNGVTAATAVCAMGFRALGATLRFVGAQMIAMMANPVMVAVMAVVALGMALKHLSDSAAETKKAQEDYAASTAALASKLDAETRAIRTKVDLRRQEAAVISELAKAYQQLDEGGSREDRAGARKRVAMLRDELEKVRATAGGVMKSDEQYARDKEKRDDSRGAEVAREDIFANRGPEQALKIAEQRLQVIKERKQAAMELEELERAAENRADAAREASQENYIEEQRVIEALVKWRGKLNDAKNKIGGSNVQPLIESVVAMYEKKAAEFQAARLGGGDEVGALLNSGSEIQALQAQIMAYDELSAAKSAAAAATEALNNAEKKEKAAAQKNVDAAQIGLSAIGSVADQAGVTGWGAGQREEAKIRLEELQARRSEDLSQTTEVNAAEEVRKRAVELAKVRMEAEMALDSIRLKGDDREYALLNAEKNVLELKFREHEISKEQYDREMKLNAARVKALDKESKERAEVISNAMVMGRLQRQLSDAVRTGDKSRADELRKQIADREYAAERAAAKLEAEGNSDPAAGQAMANERLRAFRETQAQAEAARRRDEEQGKAETRRSVGSNLAGLQAQLMKMTGQSEAAKRLQKANERANDDMERMKQRNALMMQGFGSDEAGRLANQAIKADQGSRLLDRLMNQKGTVVASSLAQIGGGGGVYGNDPAVNQLQKIVDILKQINDGVRENVEGID